MAKTLEQIKAEELAMDIQEWLSSNPALADMKVEDFVFYLLDYYKNPENDNI